MAKAYLGIGGNIGDRMKNIEETISMLKSHGEIEVIRISSVYETEPVGYVDQDAFLNIVVEIGTTLDPYDLLDYCHVIEGTLKRERLIRWGPRTIDVDILLYEGFISDDEKLIVPHPRMLERAFVMIPLYEIAPDMVIDGKDVREVVEGLKTETVKRLK
ncbi:MAG: 2-amino-4-hydroxy-6-hydroxymethyldihydropteridine diphosphokinase [Bacillota bacterium]